MFYPAAPWMGRFFDADAGANGASNGADNAGDSGDSGGDTSKPFATFPDEASFNTRMERAVRSQMTSIAKELGFDSPDALTQAAKTARERADAEKTELDKAHETVASLNGKISTYQAQLVNARAEALALAAGVPAERAAYAVRMADLSAVAVDGEIDQDALKAAIEQVIKDVPELAGAAANRRSSLDFNSASGEQGGKTDMNALIRRAGHRS